MNKREDSDKLRTLLKQLSGVAEEYGKKDTLEKVGNAITQIEETTSVLICGEFKRGKSSIVNAIIGETVCPTDVGIATSVVTLIKYGNERKAFRYHGNLSSMFLKESGIEWERIVEKDEIRWEEVEEYVMGKEDGEGEEKDDTILVELFCPVPFLQGGITVIDTPGIGGLDPRHAILTQMVLPRADVIVFVVDSGEPLTQSEKKFYKDKVVSCGKKNLVLVNKSDMLSVDQLKTHIHEIELSLADIQPAEIVPVSAINWNNYIRYKKEEFRAVSNNDKVLAAITSSVEASKKERLKVLRDMIMVEVEDISAAVTTEVEQLRSDEKQKGQAIVKLQQQQSDLLQFRTEIKDPTSEIRLQINAIFENARNSVGGKLAHEGTILTTTEFDALLEDKKALEDNGKWLVAQLNDRIENLSRGIEREMNHAFEEISKRMEAEIGGLMNGEAFVLSDNLRGNNIVNSQLAFSIAGKVMTGSIIGSIAAVGMEVLIPGIGWLAGVATAAALIWKQVSREVQQQKKAALRQQLLPKINLVLTDMRNQVNTRFAVFNQNLLQVLQTMASETQQKLNNLQASITNSRTSQQAGSNRIVILEQRKKFLDNLSTQMKLLYTKPFVNVK